MLGHWRIVLRQAEESARAGRFDEALTLTSRADVADHRRVVQLRDRLAGDLLGRAGRRAAGDDVAGAMDDMDLAERLGAPPDALAVARQGVADRVAEEVRGDLDAGEPARVVERIEELARRKVGGTPLRRVREAAEAWRSALEEARRGEFGRAVDQLDRAARLAGAGAAAALEAARRDLEARQQAAHPRVDRLYAALAAGKWTETLAAAEAVLETVPEHPAARQARTLAWQQIGAIAPAAAAPLPPRSAMVIAAEAEPIQPIRYLTDVEPGRPPIPQSRRPDRRLTTQELRAMALHPAGATPPDSPGRPGKTGPAGRFLLWADAVGGYLVCMDEEVVLGRAGPDGEADIPLLGDVARNHAVISRDGDGYVIRANHPTCVNNRKVASAPLRDGDVIRLGPTLELEFRQPSPVSTTARLAILSRHRLPLAVDGVILMGETCIVGPSAQAHVRAPNLADPVVLYRQGGSLWCRAPGTFEVDGRGFEGRARLHPRSGVRGDGFSFSLEPLGPQASPA